MMITYNTDEEDEKSSYIIPLMAHSIKNRNLNGLHESYLNQVDAEMLIQSLATYPQYLFKNTPIEFQRDMEEKDALSYIYTLLDLAVVSQWTEGINLIFAAAARLIHDGKPTAILAHILYYNNLTVLKSLVEHGVSLYAKYPLADKDYLKDSPITVINSYQEYPLITAIRLELGEDSVIMSNYIKSQIGDEIAINQILDRVGNPERGDTPAFKQALSNHFSNLIRNQPPNLAPTLVSVPLTPLYSFLFSLMGQGSSQGQSQSTSESHFGPGC